MQTAQAPRHTSFGALFDALLANVERVIQGKREPVRLALVSLFAEGHLLIEDVPGVVKTSMAKAIARSIAGTWSRIQFTPDLLPSDVTGVSVWNRVANEFEFRPGGVFANVVLADEINRASPKTQSALLEAMEEQQVTVDSHTYGLRRPFMVIATQNPIELEGTYPLPEAQLDRFLVKTVMPYPTREAELELLTRYENGFDAERLNDADFPVSEVLNGIDAAAAAGLAPIKVNMVVKRGANEDSVIPMARYFKGSGHIVRFIEYMDVGVTNGWRMDDVLPSAQIVRMIGEKMPLEPVEPNYTGEVAERWRYRDGSGEIGVISSVTQAFCRTCTRARLSTEGMLYTCLFATAGYDLRGLLRGGSSEEEISDAIARIWRARTDRYSEIRTAETAKLRKIEMSYIGG